MLTFEKIYGYNVPTFLVRLLIAFLLFQGSSVLAGHASFYDFRLDAYHNYRDTIFLSPKIGVQHVFSDLSFRLFSIGGWYSDPSHGYAIMDFGYGKYWNVKKHYKIATLFMLEQGYDFRSDLLFKSLICLGGMRRLNSRFSAQCFVGFPIVSTHQKSSFIISVGLNYFYGSGIAYRESSDMLKNVKKKFLRVLWFYD
ncbi:hypothetical protein DID74_02575 [Candidatus Marinamargulisbacteria bacterium SCGC AG-333-B06]|nr:hypothetical protein DID74_02575 [Candidatus Marinamargulisbacteria bacterium SCGC AG-333-B06]